jgi:pSer/pThr/pTyr-binding forkhead associated (FHA) protein
MAWRITAFDKDGREIAHLELDRGELTIGRDSDRQLVLPSASVSRRHARIVVQDGGPCIVDEGSSNGVLINGVRIVQPTAIGPSTRIDVAEFRIQVESTMPTAGVAPLPPPVNPPSGQSFAADGFRLIAEGGPYDGRVLNLPPGLSHVGRATDNDHVFDDPSLSRKHARIYREGGQVSVEDLGSSNGTYVNGRRVQGRQPVSPGDVVRFGDLSFRYEGGAHGSTRAVGPSLPRIELIALAGGGGVTLIILIIAMVTLIRKVPPVQASGREAMAKMQRLAEGHLQNGKQLYRDKKYSDAKTELEPALELDPANQEARKLRALAQNGADDDRALAGALPTISIGDKKGLEIGLRYYGQMTEGSSARAQLAAKLVPRLVQFGQERCMARAYVDCQWALCKAYEVAPADGKPDSRAARSLLDVERKLARSRGFVPCRVAP